MARPHRPAANDARAASGTPMAPTRDLFAELDAVPATHDTAAPPDPVAQPLSCGAVLHAPEPCATEEGTPLPATEPEPRISYAEAERLMTIGRTQGPDALTPEQHHAIWDCLLELPESQAWLAAQLTALQGELQERGLRPWSEQRTAR